MIAILGIAEISVLNHGFVTLVHTMGANRAPVRNKHAAPTSPPASAGGVSGSAGEASSSSAIPSGPSTGEG
jgi:hypothetical protein